MRVKLIKLNWLPDTFYLLQKFSERHFAILSKDNPENGVMCLGNALDSYTIVGEEELPAKLNSIAGRVWSHKHKSELDNLNYVYSKLYVRRKTRGII